MPRERPPAQLGHTAIMGSKAARNAILDRHRRVPPDCLFDIGKQVIERSRQTVRIPMKPATCSYFMPAAVPI
jgi:hypothetical protein